MNSIPLETQTRGNLKRSSDGGKEEIKKVLAIVISPNIYGAVDVRHCSRPIYTNKRVIC